MTPPMSPQDEREAMIDTIYSVLGNMPTLAGRFTMRSAALTADAILALRQPGAEYRRAVEDAARVAEATRPEPETCGLDVLYGYERGRHDIATAIRLLPDTKGEGRG